MLPSEAPASESGPLRELPYCCALSQAPGCFATSNSLVSSCRTCQRESQSLSSHVHLPLQLGSSCEEGSLQDTVFGQRQRHLQPREWLHAHLATPMGVPIQAIVARHAMVKSLIDLYRSMQVVMCGCARLSTCREAAATAVRQTNPEAQGPGFASQISTV